MLLLFSQSCLTLYNTMDYSPPGSSVHGIYQQEYWSGLPVPSPGNLPNPGIKPESPALAGRFFTTELSGKSLRWMCLVAQLCPTLCNSMVCNPPGSSVHGILQARIPEWVAIQEIQAAFRRLGKARKESPLEPPGMF